MDSNRNSEIIEAVMKAHKVGGKVLFANKGPRVTRYDVKLDVSTKVRKLTAIQQELAMALNVPAVRATAVPEFGVIGVEVPNEVQEIVTLEAVLADERMHSYKLPIAVGVDSVGVSVVSDLTAMPHLLIAGSTGSGKSIALSTMINGLIASKTPSEMRMVLMDPKRVEFPHYNGVPHLLRPVITDAAEAAVEFGSLEGRMEQRYRAFETCGVRNIDEFNSLGGPQLPYIVVVVDELADMVLDRRSGKQIEDSLIKLAQKSRASGIHMIVATQRPVVRVVSGLVKANFPSRMAFRVPAKVDSMTVLDIPGAEDLLGKGDMLFLTPGLPNPIRVQGALTTGVHEAEIEASAKVAYKTTPVIKPRVGFMTRIFG